MKVIRVVAAIIIDSGKVFATQRGYGEFNDGWEFPGGKIEPGETPEAAIVREIKVHTAENISNHRVAAFGCNIVRIKLLYDRAVKHSTGGIYFHSVIENINVYLADDLHIVTMNQRIDNDLMYCLFGVFGHLNPSIAGLFPPFFGIVLNELGAVLQPRYQ